MVTFSIPFFSYSCGFLRIFVYLMFLCFETGSHLAQTGLKSYITKDDLELLSSCLYLPWDNSVSPYAQWMLDAMLGIIPRALCMLGTLHTN